MYDFSGGKEFWLAHGLPTEGPSAATQRAITAAERDVPVCDVVDPGSVAIEAMAGIDGWDECFVVGCQETVVGRVRRSDLDNDPAVGVDQVMELGPTSVRPHVPLDEAMEHVGDSDGDSLLVTDPMGKLLGVLREGKGELPPR